MRGHRISDQTRERAETIIVTNRRATISKLAQLSGLPHGTIGNLRLDCVRRGLVSPLRDENQALSPVEQARIVDCYREGYSIRDVARRLGVSYYTVRLVLSIHEIGLRGDRRSGAPSPKRGVQLPSGGDTLDCLCWCEAQIIAVDRVKVLAGETASCGRADCRPISGDSGETP